MLLTIASSKSVAWFLTMSRLCNLSGITNQALWRRSRPPMKSRRDQCRWRVSRAARFPPLRARPRRCASWLGSSATSGSVRLGATATSLRLPPWTRTPASCFPELMRLFPHMSVAENVAFRPLYAPDAKPKWRRRYRSVAPGAARSSQRIGCLRNYRTCGQQQRLALGARAGCSRPDVCCSMTLVQSSMPTCARTSALNPANIATQARSTRCGDPRPEEALTMADRLVVHERGSYSPDRDAAGSLRRPSENFVADFSGPRTFHRLPHGWALAAFRLDPAAFVVRLRRDGTVTHHSRCCRNVLALMSVAPLRGHSFPGAVDPLLSLGSQVTCRPPVAEITCHRADPEPAGTALPVYLRKTGPIA